MTKHEVMDFTDYAESLEFKYKDEIFEIPSFDKETLEKLMSIHSRMPDKPEDDVDEKVTSAEAFKRNQEFFDLQDEFLLIALRKKSTGEIIDSDTIKPWPMKLKSKVMSLVGEQMSMSSSDDEDSAKK